MSKKNIPELRFPGFENEWVQHKLSDLYSEGWSGGTPTASNAEFYKGSIPYLSISDLKSREIFNTEKHITQAAIDSSAAKLKPAGYLALAMYASVGKIAIINVDSATSQAFWNMRFENETTRNFVFSRLQKADNYKEWEPLISTGTQRNLNAQKVSNLKIYTPSVDEQEKIGSFFQYVDNTISIHLKKLEDLQKLKSGLLQKMFPRKGEKVPQIRFPEFNDDWEQRKLDEMVSFYPGLTYKPGDVKESGTLVLRSSNVKNDSIIDADNVYVSDEIANSEQVQIGDIIVVVRNGSRDLIGKHAIVSEEMPNTVIGAFMTGIRSEQPGFINALLNTSGFQDEINKNMGSTIHQITGYMFANMKFAFPSTEEQKQIGEFFNTIDETITLHQRKIDDLNKLKSGLLQKMFI